MKKRTVLFALIFVLLLAGASSAEMEPVKVGVGSLQISGLFQIGFNYYIGDEVREKGPADLNHNGLAEADGSESDVSYAADRPVDMEFVARRLRLALQGTVVDEHVGYFIQTELADPTGPKLLDARLAFSYIPYTTVSFGRFVPKFTYWAPMFQGNIFLIELPQLNTFLGVQRQTGVNIGVFHKYFEFDFGAFNGRNEPNISLNPADRGGAPLGTNTTEQWNDENTAKDSYASIAVKPLDGLKIYGGYWYGLPLDYFKKENGELTERDANVGIINAGLAYFADFGLHLWGEMMYETVKFNKKDSTDDTIERDKDYRDYTAMSWYAMGGYNFKNVGVPFEIVARYDWLDPDTANDEKTHGKDDETTHITAGFNYYIQSYYAMFSINYVYRQEAYTVWNKKLTKEQTGIQNDSLLAQVQVAF